MVTTTEVEWAYRLFCGREPESRDVVEYFANKASDAAELRRIFMTSPEFISGLESIGQASAVLREQSPLPADLPETVIETAIDDANLDRLFDRIEEEFSYLGRTEPFWSVLADDRYKLANIGNDEERAFYHSGHGIIETLKLAARRHGIALPESGVCLDLGCGLGRNTIWLAELFAHVVAVDISAAHLTVARQAVIIERGKHNVELLHVNSRTGYINLPEFDAFVSLLVLQHNSPPLMAFVLRQVLRKLRPGGVGYFQIPVYGLHYSFTLQEYLGKPITPGMPEMHALPQATLFRLIDEADCELLDIREDGAAGPIFLSNRILIRKRSAG